MKYLILFCIFTLIHNAYYKTSDILPSLRAEVLPKTTYQTILDNTKSLIKYYVFLDIAKKPPQPDFDQNYFPEIDILKKLSEIEITDTTNTYDFFRDVHKAILSLGDLHTKFICSTYSNIKFILPFLFSIKYENNKINVYAIKSANDDYYNSLGLQSIKELLEQNVDQTVKSINDKTPFEFIQNFYGENMQLKNKHGSYTFKSNYYYYSDLNSFPLNEEDLLNITLEYDNGVIIKTEYYFYVPGNIEDIKEAVNSISFKENENLNLNEIEDKFRTYNNDYKYVSWDYIYPEQSSSPSITCREDIDNEVNVYYANSFNNNNNLETAIFFINKCTELFDKNDYPIIVIFAKNEGGSASMAFALLEMIQPHISKKIYMDFRANDGLDDIYNNGFFKDYYREDNCKKMNLDYILENYINEKYDNNVENIITQMMILKETDIEDLEEKRNNIKRKRKPTEIIVMTDGYSYSSASIFCKTLQNEGGAIFVGYMGNPELKDYPFDASQSASFVYSLEALKPINSTLITEIQKYGIRINSLTFLNTFTDPNQTHIPEEYSVKEVDERINIYYKYIDSEYQNFINEAKNIYNKYKNQCNPKNKKLTLFDDKCIFNDSNLHGGYACGNDGYWNYSNCVPIYCNYGYYYDQTHSKCEKDPCLHVLNETNEIIVEKIVTEEKCPSWLIALTVIFGVLFLGLLLVLIVTIYKKKKGKVNINNLNEGLNLEK